MFAKSAVHDFSVHVEPLDHLFDHPGRGSTAPPWVESWSARSAEIIVLLAFLAILTAALARPHAWVTRPMALSYGRPAALAVTLGFIGWYGQGQLSIVNVMAVLGAMTGNGDLRVFLYDPFTVILWLYVLPTLVIWGRGTFCGWLCPYGALQEFTAEFAPILQLDRWRWPERMARHLLWGKYLVLLVLILLFFTAPQALDQAVEIEPFKTAITLGFDRTWPFVAYGVAVLALGLVVYKGFCRVLCPLGAFLAILGRLRRWDWIARRPQCGQPCRLCEVRCRYGAIGRDGTIAYSECFQCLDCVAIHDDAKTCVPLVLAAKKRAP